MPVPASTHRSACGAAALLAVVVAASGDRRLASAHEPQPIDALAPVDVLASRFRQPVAVAVEASGAILVVDRAAGTLTRVGSDGARALLVSDLRRPNGVAVDGAGRIFVIEAAGRRILRIDADGHVALVASLLRQPRAIAAAPDGRMWVAMRDKGARHDVISALDESGALTEVAAGFVDVEALAAARGAIYVTTARLAAERGPRRTAVVRVALDEDGAVGGVEPLLSAEVGRAAGLGVDALGDLFVSGVSADERRGRDGVVLKWDRAGDVSRFANGLRDAAALAFAPNGDLIALELGYPHRLLRFRAPPPPVPMAPEFANTTPLPIGGRTLPGDRVQIFEPLLDSEPVATTIADARGEFTLAAPLAPNARSVFVFRATAAGGRGLASGGVMASITHDDVLPRVMTLEPTPGAHVRRAVILRGRGEDDGSGVAAVSFLLDDALVASVSNPAPPDALAASAVLETDGMVEGLHALTTTAVDRAGNSQAAAQLLVVDRTPPDTLIVSGPGAETVERSVRFDIAGTDVWSPALEFSWRLDEGPWSAYGPAPVIELVDLMPGPHRFEVRARDLAGNEDPTPAVLVFTVITLRVRILEPADGAVITTSSVWIRGLVEGGGEGEITVRLVSPAAFGGSVAAPVERGMFAFEVPADPIVTSVALVAVQGGSTSPETSVSIAVIPDAAPEESLELWPPGGLAPLTVRIGLHGFSGLPVAIDADGDGTHEFEGVLDGDDFYATYAQSGVYLPTARIMTPDGNVRTRRGIVEVYDGAVLDTRLQAVWSGFKQELRNGDLDSAVSFIVAERRGWWAEYFRALPPALFADVDELFPAITLMEVGSGGAQYEMVAERDGLMFSYPVWFQIDADGRWRLWRF
jgi:hypothetical protein